VGSLPAYSTNQENTLTLSIVAEPEPGDRQPPDMGKAALWYATNGIPVFPLHYPVAGACSCGSRDCSAGKHPLTQHGLHEATTDIAQVTRWWQQWPAANIGMPTGAASGRVVVDTDPRNGGPVNRGEIIQQLGPIPDTGEVQTGGDGRHLHFLWDNGPVPKAIAKGVDLKGNGGYVVMPPSLHISGKRYAVDGRDPGLILDPAPAPGWLKKAIVAARANGHAKADPDAPVAKWGQGERNNNLASIAGSMRRRGCSRGAIEAALLGANAAQCDPPLTHDEGRQIAASVARYEPHADESDPLDEWQEPEPLQAELPPVEAFYEDLLPRAFRALVADAAERMQVPMDYSAAIIILCLAGIVSRRAVIQPKANDSSWIVVPNLWGGVIAPPGFMKSPVIQAATRPLNRIQEEWRTVHDEELKDYAKAKEEYELKYAVWKEEYKRAAKSGEDAPDRPEDAPEEPKPHRLVVNDATFEALHEIMSDNPAGVLVIRDELTGWWSQLDRTGREGERAFCLSAWNGDTGHDINRIGRGTIHVEACCMSMLGGIQPGRLRSYLVDALKDGPSNDGLIQRFQLLVWPDTPPEWDYIDRLPDAASGRQIDRVFRTLVKLSPKNPLRFRFSLDAQERVFVPWLTELEGKVRGNELHPALISHLSKYRSLMPSLALLFELADQAAQGGIEGSEGPRLGQMQNFLEVSLDHAKQAAAWCDYLESHARRVYSCVTSPQLRAAQELADKIKRRKIGADGFFSCRDVYFKGWSGLHTPEAVKQAAEILEDAGWLRDVSPDPGRLGGRPTNRYQINPRVRE
jgi:putative DNA primase/helicase